MDTNRRGTIQYWSTTAYMCIHVTHAEYCFPQAYHIKQHPLQYFCTHSTYQYVPSTYSGKIVRTRYVLGVNSTYYVCTSTYSYKSNSHFISGTITLAAVTSLLPTLVRRFEGRILPIRSLLDCQAAQARLATSKLPQPRVDLIDVAATPAIFRSCVCTSRRET
jgi:hypothetical protein